jgi:hypothetical protein
MVASITRNLSAYNALRPRGRKYCLNFLRAHSFKYMELREGARVWWKPKWRAMLQFLGTICFKYVNDYRMSGFHTFYAQLKRHLKKLFECCRMHVSLFIGISLCTKFSTSKQILQAVSKFGNRKLLWHRWKTEVKWTRSVRLRGTLRTQRDYKRVGDFGFSLTECLRAHVTVRVVRGWVENVRTWEDNIKTHTMINFWTFYIILSFIRDAVSDTGLCLHPQGRILLCWTPKATQHTIYKPSKANHPRVLR